MKYLFINSVAGVGSTGRIAVETCLELMGEGHECLLAYGRTAGNCQDVPLLRIGTDRNVKIHGACSRIFDNQGFCSRKATKKFVEQVKQYDPDVIWLHNLHGYYLNLPILFEYLHKCGKKILWTLHDCWAMTGHCAYYDYVQCDRWKTGCHDCPQKKNYPASLVFDRSRRNYALKKELFTGIPNLTLITPSQWLAGRVKQSFLGEYPVEVVYNRVDTSVFRPKPSDFRQKHGLLNKKVVLGVANIWEERKGLKDFVALSSMLDDRFRIVLVGLTEEQAKGLPENILSLPRTDSIEQLVEIYSAADVYVSPSVEETFGMTVLEAHCCGTPAIVYEDTACEEVVNQFGGVAVPRGAEHLCAAILDQCKEN